MADIDPYITVLTVTYPQELAVVRARLESEEIECEVQNELTTQIAPYYSDAIGGVKLQVKQSDVAKAVQLLKEWGYIKESEKEEALDSKLSKLTSWIPFVSKFKVETRLLIIGVLITLILVPVYMASGPSLFDKVVRRSWCLDYVSYDGKVYTPGTQRGPIRIEMEGMCEESMAFFEDGSIVIPGFQSPSIRGKWWIQDGYMYISRVDTFNHIFDGAYNVDFSEGLTLSSPKTTIRCYSY